MYVCLCVDSVGNTRINSPQNHHKWEVSPSLYGRFVIGVYHSSRKIMTNADFITIW